MSESKEGKGGDTYIIHQAGAVGPGAQAHDMQFQQIWNQYEPTIQEFSNALKSLKDQMLREAQKPEHYESIAKVAEAGEAIAMGDIPKTLNLLKTAGKFVVDAGKHVPAIFTAEGIWKILEHVCH